MIEGHGDHDGDVGIDEVDCVQPPAQADFEHDRVRSPGLEHEQRGKRVELEERQRLAFERIGDALEGRDQRDLRDPRAVESDPLGNRRGAAT